MENEPPAIAMYDDGRGSKRGRLMGKLFGRDRDKDRERKNSQEDNQDPGDLNDFFRGSTDTLRVTHAAPPTLAKLDIQSATRYPNALNVHNNAPGLPAQDLTIRSRPKNLARKGLVVRFAETYPEIMGQGGDECEDPTVEISRRKKQRPSAPARAGTVDSRPRPQEVPGGPGSPRPRAATTSHPQAADGPEQGLATRNPSTRHLLNPASQDEKRRSFIEIHQAQMREAEGTAFANAVRSASIDASKDPFQDPPPSSRPTSQGTTTSALAAVGISSSPVSSLAESPEVPQHAQFRPSPQPPPHKYPLGAASASATAPLIPPRASPQKARFSSEEPRTPSSQKSGSPDRLKRDPRLDRSSPSLPSVSAFQPHPFAASRQNSRISDREHGPPMLLQQGSSSTLHDVVSAVSDDAMNKFVTRTRHLFELFRLHSESVRTLSSCTVSELARAGLWWFLMGRMALENAIRERPTTPESEMKNERVKQQAYADLSKAYWLVEEIMPGISGSQRGSPVDSGAQEVRDALLSGLRKLSVSMKRNGFLPPEELFLPQVVDRTIWIEYPQVSQDVKSLLCGSSSSALSHDQQISSGMSIIESLPLGDSAVAFCFGRFQVDGMLMEQGRESRRLLFPCFLSVVRPQQQADIKFIITSQNGTVQLRLSGNKSEGPVWEDVRWRAETCHLEVRLPRGFVFIVQCNQQSYSTLRSMYEFSAKVHNNLFPRKDENCIFRSTLRAFQYFDNDPQARQFPKESTPGCEIALFERILREGAATGPRTYHRGFRIAVVTGPQTKTLSGINQTYGPQSPIQFGFLRSEGNEPALSLKFENGRLKGSMVMSFADEKERLRIHSLLIGTALDREESNVCDVPLEGAWFSERYGDTSAPGLQVLSSLPWHKARVINHDKDGNRMPSILSEKLRIVFEFKDGTLTDRINVAPGELKLRLDVHNPNCMMLFRQPQADFTLAVTEAKVPRETTEGLTQALDVIKNSPTIRTLMFPNLESLHAFETGITGFRVLFDGIASAFAIARRRMVVPIHKKWEAGATRIQVVQHEGATQILAFFDDFSHGQCMGFSLKGTDVFEAFGRGAKAGVKIVDAKFPLPKVLGQQTDGAQEASDAAFLCLDLPELPGEHDDISIVFETEAERDKFSSSLPAPVKESSSRLPKIKGIS